MIGVNVGFPHIKKQRGTRLSNLHAVVLFDPLVWLIVPCRCILFVVCQPCVGRECIKPQKNVVALAACDAGVEDPGDTYVHAICARVCTARPAAADTHLFGFCLFVSNRPSCESMERKIKEACLTTKFIIGIQYTK